MISLSDYIAGDKRAGFTLAECCFSETAAREGIDNTPPAEIVPVIAATARAVLMPIRMEFNTPFSPNSFYRSLALEYIICARAIKKKIAAAESFHKVDWESPEVAGLYARGLGGQYHPAALAYLERKQHPKGNAIDIRVPRVDVRALAEWIIYDSAIAFDQVILEMWNPPVSPGWVHVSWVKQNPRREVLCTADGVTYQKGLP